jgi:hypothetical protein
MYEALVLMFSTSLCDGVLGKGQILFLHAPATLVAHSGGLVDNTIDSVRPLAYFALGNVSDRHYTHIIYVQ